MKDINILALFGISIESLEKYEQVDNDDESVTFLARQIKSDEVCSACRSSDIVVKDYRIKIAYPTKMRRTHNCAFLGSLVLNFCIDVF